MKYPSFSLLENSECKFLKRALQEGGKKVGDMEMINCSVESSEICRCNELDERSVRAEARCAELELELQKKKTYCEALETELNSVEKEKTALDYKVSGEALKGYQLSDEREKKKNDVDSEEAKEGEDKVILLTAKVRVLEIEKIKAESKARVWKERFKKLEAKALESGLKLANLDCHEENGKQDSVLVKPEERSHLGTGSNFLQNKGMVVNLDDVASFNSLSAGTPFYEICGGNLLDGEAQLRRRARRHLALECEQSPSNKMAQCSLRAAKPTSSSVVDIIDSDDEPNITLQPNISRNTHFSTCDATEEEKFSDNSLKGSFYDGNNEDLNSGLGVLFTTIPKRKRTQNVVISESESSDDDDDGVPISKLKGMKFLKASHDQDRCDSNELVTATSPADDQVTDTVTPRRRLRKGIIKSQQDKKSSCEPSEDKHEQSIHVREKTNDDESEEVSSDNEEGSLSNFIVHDSDVSDYEDTSSKSQDISDGEVESDSHDVSDGQEDGKSSCGPGEDKHEQSIPTNKETDDDDESKEGFSASEEGSLGGFIVHDSDDVTSKPCDDASYDDLSLNEILSQIQRKKDQKRKWEFEGDMLAAFGKDPQLCMKAVCTLYRQQTSEEQRIRGSLDDNRRGFSSIDAFRGSSLAEFLTDGDPLGDVKKSVKDLEEYDPYGVETCRTMALRYSKQLFEIYKNKEDPCFP